MGKVAKPSIYVNTNTYTYTKETNEIIIKVYLFVLFLPWKCFLKNEHKGDNYTVFSAL